VRLVPSDPIFKCFPAGFYYTCSTEFWEPMRQIGLYPTCHVCQASWRVRAEAICGLVERVLWRQAP